MYSLLQLLDGKPRYKLDNGNLKICGKYDMSKYDIHVYEAMYG
jgi:hypothetical protein